MLRLFMLFRLLSANLTESFLQETYTPKKSPQLAASGPFPLPHRYIRREKTEQPLLSHFQPSWFFRKVFPREWLLCLCMCRNSGIRDEAVSVHCTAGKRI